MKEIISLNQCGISIFDIEDSAKIYRHDYYEMEILIDGKAVIRINDRQLLAQKGTFWMSSPGSLHHVTKKSDVARVLRISFGDDLLSDKIYNLLGMYPQGIAGQLSQEDLERFSEMLRKIAGVYESVNSELCKDIFIKNTLTAILVTLVDRCDNFMTETTEKMTEHSVFEAVSYIKKHFTEELTANGMAKRLGYTPNYFSMKFKSLTGKNFIDAVNDERLQFAYYMLSTMGISVTAVSEYVGYSSVAYFSRMFKKKFGKSPRDIKNGSKHQVAKIVEI